MKDKKVLIIVGIVIAIGVICFCCIASILLFIVAQKPAISDANPQIDRIIEESEDYSADEEINDNKPYEIKNEIEIKKDDANTVEMIEIIEFSDPSCPYCHIASGKNPELNKKSGDQFTLVEDGGEFIAPVPEFRKLVEEGKAIYKWKYLNGHGNGELGAEALYCANDLGDFWEVHDLLYTAEGYTLLNNKVKNDRDNIDTLVEFLTDVTNEESLRECLEIDTHRDKLIQDKDEAEEMGVSGTPGFIVNGKLFAGAYSYDEMKDAVNSPLVN